MDEKISLKAAADAVGITIDKVRHWSVALGFEIEKVGRVRHVSVGAVDALREMEVLISGGISPQAAAAKIKNRPQAAEIVVLPVANISPDVVTRLDGLEKAISLLVDKIASQEKTIALQEKELADQRKETASLRSRVELPILMLNAPPKPVKAWEPVRVQPIPMPWYERFWLQMFSPETLREATE